MNLDQAIEHAKVKAEQGGDCGEEHRQLAAWLQELYGLRVIFRNASVLEDALNRVREVACIYGEPKPVTREEFDLTPPHKALEEGESIFDAIDLLVRQYIDDRDPMMRRDARLLWLLTWAVRSEWRVFRGRVSRD